MTHPADPGDPIVLDSSVLVAYERMKTPGAYSLNETQSRLVEWLADRTPLLMPALSLSVAAHECGGQLPELDYLIQGDPDLVLVVPLARESAVDVGTDASSLRGEDLEVSQVLWCAPRPRRPRGLLAVAGRDLLARLVCRRRRPGHRPVDTGRVLTALTGTPLTGTP